MAQFRDASASSLTPSIEPSDAGDPQTGHLRRAATRGAMATIGGQAGRAALQLVSMAVLARLLTPADFGVIAMALTVVGLGELIRDLGLVPAMVQRQALARAEIDALFAVNVAFGAALSILTAVTAPLVASFYGSDDLVAVTAVLGLTFVMGGAAVQHEALLLRELRFGSVAAAELIGVVAGIVIGVALGGLGAGVWALVALNVVTVLGRTVCLWWMSDYRPSLPSSMAPAKSFLGFGRDVTAFNIVNYASRAIDNVLVGRFRGAAELGIYGRAYQLLLLPLRQLNKPLANVALPTLSRLHAEPERFSRYYLTALGVLSTVSMPMIGIGAAASDQVIAVALGSQWGDVADVFLLLAGASALQVVANTNGWLYVATGRTTPMVRWALASRPIVILGFVIGLPHGAEGVALSYTLTTIALTPVSIVLACRATPVSSTAVFRILGRGAALSVLAFLTTSVVLRLVDANAFVELVLATAVSACVLAGLAFRSTAMRREFRELRLSVQRS